MSPYSRRKALHLIGSAVAVGSLSGCMGLLNGKGIIGVLIENADDQEHVLDLEFKQEDTIRFSEQYTLSPGEEADTPEAVEAGEYTVQASLESNEQESLDFHMNGCTDNTLSVSIDDQGKIEMGITTVCD